jgi:Transglutaminase-like superfamily
METNNRPKLLENFFYHLVAVLCIVPLAPMINRVIPPIMIGGFNADLFLAILLSLGFVRFVLWVFKPLIIPSFVMIALIMLFNVYARTYTVSSMVSDYRNLVNYNWENRMKKDKNLFIVKPSLFDSEVERAVKGMRSQMNFKDSILRNFAVKYSTAYFNEQYKLYGPTVRYLSLFRHINGNFKYVQDPVKNEYYASPMETIDNGLAGDCDDHTILMISALNTIGAKTRMVLTEDHVYPELYCGDKNSFLKLQSAIIELFPQENFSGLYYREENGNYWINLDYSAHHPGGPYINNKAYAVVEF